MSRIGTLLRRNAALVACVGLACIAAGQSLGAFGDATGPPAPIITDAPIRATIAMSASFGFRGVAESFECGIDGTGYRPCTSPITYVNLKRTSHTFKVRGQDKAGNHGEAAAYSWDIVAPRNAAPANVVPRPVMTTVPLRPWVSRTATFGWDRRGAPGSECAIDGAEWGSCSSPKSFRRLALGRHVFHVRGVSGSRHSSANTFIWAITTAVPPPRPLLTARPSANTNSTEATFSFDVAAGMQYQCKLDSSGWQQCSNPAIYIGLGTGQHTFCVRAVRPGGLPGLPTCTTWFIHSPPDSSPPHPSASFTISGGQPSLLSPGVGGPLALTITNGQPFPLTVTDLVVTIQAGSTKPGCDGPTNLAVSQSNMVGGAVSVVVPAGGTITLPAQGATAPVLTMLNLATNQDACKNAIFTLAYAAMGTG